MIVVDASAMVEGLIGRDLDTELLDVLAGALAAPYLLDVEVMSALRGLHLGGKLDVAIAEQAVQDHFAFTIARYGIEPMAQRIWQLRHQFTTYDACYLALSEALDAPLYTCDSKLASSGHSANVRVVPTTH